MCIVKCPKEPVLVVIRKPVFSYNDATVINTTVIVIFAHKIIHTSITILLGLCDYNALKKKRAYILLLVAKVCDRTQTKSDS